MLVYHHIRERESFLRLYFCRYSLVEDKVLWDVTIYEGWNFNSGNYLFTTDTK